MLPICKAISFQAGKTAHARLELLLRHPPVNLLGFLCSVCFKGKHKAQKGGGGGGGKGGGRELPRRERLLKAPKFTGERLFPAPHGYASSSVSAAFISVRKRVQLQYIERSSAHSQVLQAGRTHLSVHASGFLQRLQVHLLLLLRGVYVGGEDGRLEAKRFVAIDLAPVDGAVCAVDSLVSKLRPGAPASILAPAGAWRHYPAMLQTKVTRKQDSNHAAHKVEATGRSDMEGACCSFAARVPPSFVSDTEVKKM